VQGGDGEPESWWDIVAGNFSGGARSVADYATGAVGGMSGWWASRQAEQEREVAEAAQGELPQSAVASSSLLVRYPCYALEYHLQMCARCISIKSFPVTFPIMISAVKHQAMHCISKRSHWPC